MIQSRSALFIWWSRIEATDGNSSCELGEIVGFPVTWN
jgi:hypothetical protein